MANWTTVFEMGEKAPDGSDVCLAVWLRQWFAGTGDGHISREGEVPEPDRLGLLKAADEEAQAYYDEAMEKMAKETSYE